MTKAEFNIVEIPLIKTLDLRHQVLKPFLANKQATIVPGDHLNGTFHLGCYKQNELVSIGSFMPETNRNFPQERQYRLRQMATSPQHLRKGYGAAIITHGIALLKQQEIELLWFDARELAFPFYQALGFNFFGDFYEVPNTGRHKLMYKNLRPS